LSPTNSLVAFEATARHLSFNTFQPVFMIRRGRHKYVACDGDAPGRLE
jgi:hypothetical protein